MAGIRPSTEVWTGEGSPTSWVVSQNLKRRHLSENQRAVIGAELVKLFEAEARKRQATSTGGAHPQLQANLPEAEKGQARDKAAQAVCVSPRSVEHARKVLRKALPEVVEAVRAGKVAVSAAAAAGPPIRSNKLSIDN